MAIYTPVCRARLFLNACGADVHRRQQFARLLHLPLVAPEACEAHGGPEFPGFGLLLACYSKGALEVRFRFRSIRFG